MPESQELPKYRSHTDLNFREVHALEIQSVVPDESPPRGASGSCIITPKEKGYASFRVDRDYCRKQRPQPGGYYILPTDGYEAFSPGEAFEAGYTRI